MKSIIITIMKLLVGLGNPGEEYIRNRHNVGFMLCDYIWEVFSTENPQAFIKKFSFDKYSHAETTTLKTKLEQLTMIKPQTFMNRSGHTIAKLMMQYKLKTEEIIVAHDDLDIPLGKFKIQQGNGPKLHNGLESIENSVGKNFWRIRIGVENRNSENRIPGEAYVLQNFTETEKQTLHTTFKSILQRLETEKMI